MIAPRREWALRAPGKTQKTVFRGGRDSFYDVVPAAAIASVLRLNGCGPAHIQLLDRRLSDVFRSGLR